MPEVETKWVDHRRGIVRSDVRTNDERVRVTVDGYAGHFVSATIESNSRARPLRVALSPGEARGVSEALRVRADIPTEDEARYRGMAEQATADFERARREWVAMKAERDEAREDEVRARTDAVVAERNVESLVLAMLSVGKAIGVLRDDLPGITGPEALHFANDIEGQAKSLREAAERLTVTRAWDSTLPCPDCGNMTVFGHLLRTEEGRHQHTHYVCSFWPSGGDTTRCGWTGYTVPGWDDETAEHKPGSPVQP